MLFMRSKNKDIIHNEAELQKIVSEVISQTATIAGKTLGPGGRVVLLDRGDMKPISTKDGVSVIKHLGFAQSYKNTVLDVCKEISLNTARDAGDGTTTALVLANAIYQYGREFMSANPKVNPQKFVRELKNCYETVILPYLKENSQKVTTEHDLEKVALISANGDELVAKAVVQAIVAAGEDGTVLIQEDQGGEIRVETIDGYVVVSGLKDLGAIGTNFINDRATQSVKMDEGLVVLFDGVLNDLTLLTNVQSAYESDPIYIGRPLIIIAQGFADPVIEKCLSSSKRGTVVLPIKAPKSSLPNSRTMFLTDMSAFTSATLMDPVSASTFDIQHFGHFKKATVNTYEAFIQSESDADLIDARVQELKAVMSSAHSEHDRSHLRAHIGKLTGGISTIWVGGMTDAEILERRDRVQDAVEAVRSAIAEGVVAGGAATHLAIASLIEELNTKPSWQVLSKSLRIPFCLILENCGEAEQTERALSEILANLKNKKPTLVFDADQHDFVEPWSVGIIEPSKVHRISIGNAISVASLLVTLGGIVVQPSNPELETQMALSAQAFKDALSQGEDQ